MKDYLPKPKNKEQQIDNDSSREDHILTPMLVNDFDEPEANDELTPMDYGINRSDS